MSELPPVLVRYIEGLKSHDVAAIAGTVADDVAFVAEKSTLDKGRFLAFLGALYAAFPDWSYDHDAPQVQSDGSIAVRWRQSGTHRGTLALAGLPHVAPTGKRVHMPEQFFYYKFAGGEIVEIRPERVPGGAPGGIFEQIGVDGAV